MIILIIALIAYLLGSIPSAFLIGKLFYGVDIRKLGSGNVGTSNALRNFGKKAGIITLILDVLKGFLATFIGYKLGGVVGSSVAMFFVVLGHMFSFLLKFKSGKGVATAFGALLFIDYQYALILIAIFAICVMIFRIISISSIIGIIAAIILGYFRFGLSPVYYTIILLSLLITIKHSSNIKRLLEGKENKTF